MELLAKKVHYSSLKRTKGSDVVECAILVCVLCQPVPPSSHPYIGRFLLEIFYKFLMNTVMLCSGAIDNDWHTVIRPWIPGHVKSVVLT